MKLKKVTLIALFLFVGFFVVLIFVPATVPSTVSTPEVVKTGEGTDITPDALKVLTAANVAKHSTATDCYLIVKGSVYNVTPFIGQHPGGRDRIIEMCGQEATEIFSAIHSNFAWNLLKDFYIGSLVN
jgi:cytochrome b involved in lipid metabolism